MQPLRENGIPTGLKADYMRPKRSPQFGQEENATYEITNHDATTNIEITVTVDDFPQAKIKPHS